MTIGIDISQLVYKDTGVSIYLENFLTSLLKTDKENKYVLFGASFRRKEVFNEFITKFQGSNVEYKFFRIPQTLLNQLWNNLHVFPIERLIGNVDVFITSDWTEPPSKAKKATIIYDLIVYKRPRETDKNIIKTQRKKLRWVKKESDIIFCISEATKKDIMEILGIDKSKIKVIYPAI